MKNFKKEWLSSELIFNTAKNIFLEKDKKFQMNFDSNLILSCYYRTNDCTLKINNKKIIFVGDEMSFNSEDIKFLLSKLLHKGA